MRNIFIAIVAVAALTLFAIYEINKTITDGGDDADDNNLDLGNKTRGSFTGG